MMMMMMMMISVHPVIFSALLTISQWRFYVEARGGTGPQISNLSHSPTPNFYQGNLGLTFPHV